MEGNSASVPQRCSGNGEGAPMQRHKQERECGDARCRLTVGSASCNGRSSPQVVRSASTSRSRSRY
jgi:hypothetical protein